MNVKIELEADAIAKLEGAKCNVNESLSTVVRRGQFPSKPHSTDDLLKSFRERAGRSALSEEALNRLEETQQNPIRSLSRWA